MKRTFLLLLLAPFALSSCETAHNAAVSTFRVIDAPHVYMRRKLGLDQEPQTASTTTTTTQTQVYSDTAGYPPSQSYPVQPPPATSTQRRTVSEQNNPTPPAEAPPRPTATPRVASRTAPRTESTTSTTPRTASTQNSDLPYGKPVPGKPGYVFSPYDKNGGYVDVTGYTPGQKVKDPYTGKVFLVP